MIGDDARKSNSPLVTIALTLMGPHFCCFLIDEMPMAVLIPSRKRRTRIGGERERERILRGRVT